MQRRRAFMSCFTGTSNFNLLDQTIEDYLPRFFESWKEKKTIDIRAEVTKVFEDIVSIFLFGKDADHDMISMQVIKEDGSVVEET